MRRLAPRLSPPKPSPQQLLGHSDKANASSLPSRLTSRSSVCAASVMTGRAAGSPRRRLTRSRELRRRLTACTTDGAATALVMHSCAAARLFFTRASSHQADRTAPATSSIEVPTRRGLSEVTQVDKQLPAEPPTCVGHGLREEVANRTTAPLRRGAWQAMH